VGAKLIGAYERELHPVIERILASDMRRFVDIGSAEGYYVVGVARRRPDVEVVAFDIDATARQMCRMMARANGTNPAVGAEATVEYLAIQPPQTVIFSDCEGAEGVLLDPNRAPALRTLLIVVEVHDFIRPGLSTLLRARFSPTHRIQEVRAQPRDPSAFPEIQDFSPADQALTLSEGRPGGMSWLVMDPH
jgi:hypothetical protein